MDRGQVSVYLGGDVIRGAAEGASGVALEHALPAHPKVGYLYVRPRCQAAHYPASGPCERGKIDRTGMNHFDRSPLQQSLAREDMMNLCQGGGSTKPWPRRSVPVDDAFAVEVEEAHCYLCCIEPAERGERGDEGGGGGGGGGGRSLLVALCFQLIQKRMMTRGEERGSGAGEGDERDSNQRDERWGGGGVKDEERELGMSVRARIRFR